jgi:hypothetical protein
VIEFDQQRIASATINDTGRAAGNAETAARTRTLLCALKSDEFHINSLKGQAATSFTPFKKTTRLKALPLFVSDQNRLVLV